jgi:hypothetical protein
MCAKLTSYELSSTMKVKKQDKRNTNFKLVWVRSLWIKLLQSENLNMIMQTDSSKVASEYND